MPEVELLRKTRIEQEKAIQMEVGKKEEMLGIWMMMKMEKMKMMQRGKLRMLLGGKRKRGRRGW